MVCVFKTNVQKKEEAQLLLTRLMEYFPDYKINFDLEDCDKILRIEGKSIPSKEIAVLINSFSFWCEELK